MTDATRDKIEALLALADKATPGPWYNDNGVVAFDHRYQVCCGQAHYECCGNADIAGDCGKIADSDTTDAPYIAACDPDTIRAICKLALEAMAAKAKEKNDGE